MSQDDSTAPETGQAVMVVTQSVTSTLGISGFDLTDEGPTLSIALSGNAWDAANLPRPQRDPVATGEIARAILAANLVLGPREMRPLAKVTLLPQPDGTLRIVRVQSVD